MNKKIWNWIVLLVFLTGLFFLIRNKFLEAEIEKGLDGLRRPVVVNVSGDRWQKLDYILSIVEANYVDTVDRDKLMNAALEAALQSLDPHSVYMEPEPLKEAEESLSGGFEGVGLQFNVPNDTAVVLNVIAGGPAQKAGLMSGDKILKVDDKVIAGVKTPQDSMVRRMRGPKGTKVVLTVGRENEVIPFEIIRDKIPEHSVDAAFMMNENTAYLRLSKFSATTFKECFVALGKLKEEGMTDLVFDLRDNGGGYFDQVCNLANLFLDEGENIVYMEGLHHQREDVNADGRGLYKNVKLSVLIDEGSASASEIFAGAIQDNDRGVIVGRRSFGKGLVQEPVFFSDGSGIRLTVARYYTPSGRCIQKPYDNSKDYAYDFYKRYASGELMSQDSIKVDKSQVFHTAGGRTVYGGGGIVPDIFVPMDTTRATDFHIQCNKKAMTVRFANKFFDTHRSDILNISDYAIADAYFVMTGIEKQFLAFAASNGIVPKAGEWEQSREFLMPQVKGLCARYSKLGEEAYYRYILPIDTGVQAALNCEHTVVLEVPELSQE